MIKRNFETNHIKVGLQRQTRWDLQVNVGLSSSHQYQKAVAELHELARFGSNFTTSLWVWHVLYVDNNLHLFSFYNKYR